MEHIDCYGTLGPACQSREVLEEMFRQGMTGVRLNLSHTSLHQCGPWLENFQAGASAAGVKAKLLIDLQGPELRVGNTKPCQLPTGTCVTVGEEGVLAPFEVLGQIRPGQQILLDDGKILLEAEEVLGRNVRCRVLRGGLLKPRKSLALLGASLDLPTLTEGDRRNLAVAKKFGVTGVMLPFVRNDQDLKNLREALEEAGAGDIRIFAKIENRDGIKCLAQLLPHADEVVIARGDLGNSMPLWELPGVQYQVGEMCTKAGKPYMVVTQMLASMEHTAVPTRAEVSDIFYAVLHGASSVMLTGETAAGEYPVEAMHYLCRTVEAACMQRQQKQKQSNDTVHEQQ